jgi:hypothetical protein
MGTEKRATKESIISRLAEVRRKILEAALALPVKKQNEIFLGIWSVMDLLAHLAGWDYTNLEAARAILSGQLPGFYHFHDRDWQSYNAALVKKYKKNDLNALCSLVKESHKELLAFLETLTPEDFNQDKGIRYKGYKVTIGRLLAAEAQDEEMHYQQIVGLLK